MVPLCLGGRQSSTGELAAAVRPIAKSADHLQNMKPCRLPLRIAPLAAFTCLTSLTAVKADVQLPGIFGDHMVLQRDRQLPVWGWASPGEQVTVQMDNQSPASATADASGKWRIELPALPAGGPHTFTVKGRNTIALKDVLIGEIWLCSGQSNMEWIVRNCDNADKEMAAADLPEIRHIKVPLKPASVPQDDFKADWQVCQPDTVGNFTAAGFFMARKLQQELKVPIGLINSSWGGTRIEPWTPVSGFADVPALKDIHHQVLKTLPDNAEYQKRLKAHVAAVEKWTADTKVALAKQQPVSATPAFPEELKPLTSHQSPTTLYNAMIHPFLGFPFRGAIWYQGESNHGEGALYTEKMKALIQGWRGIWKQGDFPFLFVQIAPYKYGAETPDVLPTFWEAQSAATAIPNTGMVVTTDVGNVNDIHPRNKQAVGLRLALLALKDTYGKSDVIATGPTFKSLSPEGNTLRVRFDNIGTGLKSRDGKHLTWFEVIGEGSDFEKAEAKIDGDSVVLSSPKVKDPVAMRFGWHKEAEPNLANSAGLPAAPFRAGKVPVLDYLNLKVPEAAQYKLVYDIDLAKLGAEIKYDVDNSGSIKGGFDRIAYFLETRSQGAGIQYCYVSMDAFTKDIKKTGIPVYGLGIDFQVPVKNLSVISNVKGLPTGALPDGGNIEFWPNNYAASNAAKVPSASETVYDSGDQKFDPVNGYGSMQVHNHKAGVTLFAVNNWKSGTAADIGIGNNTGQTRDWTFTGNAGSYLSKRLRVLVRVK